MATQPDVPATKFADPLPDTLGAILISLTLFGTMIPMTLYRYIHNQNRDLHFFECLLNFNSKNNEISYKIVTLLFFG